MRPFSRYLDEVKQASAAAFEMDLAASTPPTPAVPISVSFDPAESRRSPANGVVLDQISQLMEVPSNRLLLTVGSSSGFLLALSAITKAGDTVVIEKPTYEPFVQTARYLGLKVERYQRSSDFEKDLASLKKAKGKVLVISNPNSPTGWLYTKWDLPRLAKLFDYVIVDEIFLPVFTNEVSRATSRSRIITLSGLSKTLGLSSLRVGWIQAAPKILRACDQIGLNTYCDVPTLPLVGASLVIPRWTEIVFAHRARVEANRAVLQDFNSRFPGVLSHDFSRGHFGVLKVPRPYSTGKSFAKALTKASVKVAACEPFDMPNGVRISAWIEPSKFQKAIQTISKFY
ncbi:MAG: pyridoxal phosphate-dependent aminotransferase [Bdellovibrionota bacterium]